MKIDFVITWVDGNDPVWFSEKQSYATLNGKNNLVNRFRDWDNLKYWFRGVEKYAPWVNKIYFITYGHLPKFLNVNNEKLVIVNHKDYIPSKYLPTYNSNVLELNLKNIKELEEHFVLFNDDIFLIDNVKEQDFFKKGKPVDSYSENPITPNGDMSQYTCLNNASVINKHYNKRAVYKKHPFKYFNFKYGIDNFRTVALLPYSKFQGFKAPHITQPFLKSYFDKLWKLEGEECDKTSLNRFREKNDITQWLVRELQLVDANFVPQTTKFGKYLELEDDTVENVVKHIKKKKSKVVCINDISPNINFEYIRDEINKAFEQILPEKSSFEL